VLASSASATATFYPSITPPPPPIYLLVRARRQNILTNNRTPVGKPPLTHRPGQIYLAHRVRRRRRTSSSSSPPPLYLDAVRTTNSLGPATPPEIDYLSRRPRFSVPCTLRARLYAKKTVSPKRFCRCRAAHNNMIYITISYKAAADDQKPRANSTPQPISRLP